MFNQNNENVFQRLIWKDDQIIRNTDYPIILTEISEVENNPFVRVFLPYLKSYKVSSFDFVIYLLSTTKGTVRKFSS